MITRIKIRPVVPGAVIRDPESRRVLPEEGAEVEETSFWTRRLLAGEVVVMQPPAVELPAERPAVQLPTPKPSKTEHKG